MAHFITTEKKEVFINYFDFCLPLTKIRNFLSENVSKISPGSI